MSISPAPDLLGLLVARLAEELAPLEPEFGWVPRLLWPLEEVDAA